MKKNVSILLIVLFILAISTFIVNAKMYKILDSEGNIVCLTNNPVLSIKEKEAGYTLSPPPEESIMPTQEQITNGQENKQQSLNQGNKYDFLNTKWGMSKEEVKKMEKGGLIEKGSKGDDLQYYGEVDGLDCYMTYSFVEDKLTTTGCAIWQPIDRSDDKSILHIYGCYDHIKKFFIKKYGEIYTEKDLEELNFEQFVKDLWDTSITKVDLSLSTDTTNSQGIASYVLLIDCKSKAEPELNP